MLKLGFSTCPNDTFIFDALVNKKIDTGNLEFDFIMADVEYLNNLALNNSIDVTKLSFNAYAYVSDYYKILNSGSALGKNCGPILISKREIPKIEIPNLKVAIPGKYTTANLLLSIAFPELKNKKEFVFSDIESAILNDHVDAGVIIHENRFTYQEKGLIKIIDLGEYWESKTKLPIPLGCIAIKRDIPYPAQIMVDRLIRQSIEFAFRNPESGKGFIKQCAQEMSEQVINSHISLYVNKYTLELDNEGKNAIKTLYKEVFISGILRKIAKDIFI